MDIITSEEDVKLLGGWPSPYSNRIQMALNLKSIKYEFIQETFVPKSDLLLKSNPVHKKIPVLFHRNKPICESLVILEYIDDAWRSSSNSPSLLPSNPYDRALARFWASYIDNKWFVSLREGLLGEGEEARKRTVEATGVIEAAYWECSKGKAYFGGDEIGYLDLVLGSYLGWVRLAEKELVGFDLLSETKTPGLVRWVHIFCSNDGVKSIIQQPENLMPTYNWIKSRANASSTS